MSASCRAKSSTSVELSSRLASAATPRTSSRGNPSGMANASMLKRTARRRDMVKSIRRAAVAGSWYPGSAQALAAAVDRHLEKAPTDVAGDLVALVAPHAGLVYSGPVAAHAYRLLRDRRFDVIVL